MTKTIFVTGSSGMLGFEVLEYLCGQRDGHVVGVSRRALIAQGRGLPNLVVERPLVPDWLGAGQQDATIVHCLGLSNPRQVFDDLAALTQQEIAPQIAMVEGLIERAWRGHLIFVSSGGTVYGDVGSLPIPETAPLNPKSQYGLAKAMLEESLTFLARRHGFQLTILRVANPYGAAIRKPDQGVIPLMIEAAVSGKPFRLIGTGQEQRDYLHISDFKTAVALACKRAKEPSVEVLNIGSGKGTSLHDLIDLVSRLTGKSLEVVRVPSLVDVRSNVLDISKSQRVLNWVPVVGIEDGVKSLIAQSHDRSE